MFWKLLKYKTLQFKKKIKFTTKCFSAYFFLVNIIAGCGCTFWFNRNYLKLGIMFVSSFICTLLRQRRAITYMTFPKKIQKIYPNRPFTFWFMLFITNRWTTQNKTSVSKVTNTDARVIYDSSGCNNLCSASWNVGIYASNYKMRQKPDCTKCSLGVFFSFGEGWVGGC